MTETLPAAWYRDVAYFERERTTVWSNEWLMFCPLAELSSSGAYAAESVAGWPVFVARQPSGKLVGFHNVCPHRAGVIVWPGAGHTGNLVCRYHGWAFEWDGTLRSARDFGEDAGLCAANQHLTEVRGRAGVVSAASARRRRTRRGSRAAHHRCLTAGVRESAVGCVLRPNLTATRAVVAPNDWRDQLET